MPPFEDALGTGEIIKFLDKLFDSFNGTSMYSSSSTTLRCRISSTSEHHHFWHSAKQLSSVSFECLKSKKTSCPPTIKNWIRTINGIEYLWLKMQKKGYTYLIRRNFNQSLV